MRIEKLVKLEINNTGTLTMVDFTIDNFSNNGPALSGKKTKDFDGHERYER